MLEFDSDNDSVADIIIVFQKVGGVLSLCAFFQNLQVYISSLLHYVLTNKPSTHFITAPLNLSFLRLYFINFIIMRSRRPYGKRVKEDVVDDVVELQNQHSSAPLEHILHQFSSLRKVSLTTVRPWFSHFLLWAEYKHITNNKIKRYKKRHKIFSASSVITDQIINTLKSIVDKFPEYYLDEIADELVK